jgi:peptide/nickel transport system permease protein
LKVADEESRRFSGARAFLREYRRYRFGTLGIAIIVFFCVLAVLAPLLTSYNPIFSYNLASPYSVPQWATAFPQYADYPLNAQLLKGTTLSASDLQYWSVSARQGTPGGGTASFGPGGGGLMINFTAPSQGGKAATVFLNQTIRYPWAFLCHYGARVKVTPVGTDLTTAQLSVNIYMKSVSGKLYHVFGPTLYQNPGDHVSYVRSFPAGTATSLSLDSNDINSNFLAVGVPTVTNLGQCGLPQGIFPRPGNVTMSISVSSRVNATVLLASPALNSQGRAFGLLGTDNMGRDVWSQFVYGARVSLEVGLVASLIAVVVGTLVGVASGYLGGVADQLLMRFTDFMLILPFLPLLLIVITIISVGNVAFPFGTEFLIIVVIAVFSWEGIARIIRAQVLTLKSRQFVEASRALGARDTHIIWNDVLPNVTGLIYANIALTVPGAILTEAAVTFLGFGDPSVVSWGTMVSNAQSAVTSTVHSFVWWWFLPPGLAIAFLSMAFLFVGFALDAVLNPKLRRR